MRRARGDEPLVPGGRPQGGGVYRGHNSRKKLRDSVSPSFTTLACTDAAQPQYCCCEHTVGQQVTSVSGFLFRLGSVCLKRGSLALSRKVLIQKSENDFLPRDDFTSSYFVAFSNDTREWTTLHDGYAEWVSGV